jgi:hypothetical protein
MESFTHLGSMKSSGFHAQLAAYSLPTGVDTGSKLDPSVSVNESRPCGWF